jgi:manganese/iron transport system permease protein
MFGAIALAAFLGGGTAGTLGVLVLGLRIPFIAVFAAHAALAGAVVSELLGVPHTVGAFCGALLGAALLGAILRKRRIDPNAALGVLFTLMLGIAFLGMGIGKGPKSAMFGLMWGSLLFVTRAQTVTMAVIAVVFCCFIFVFERELKMLLFSRELAALMLPEGLLLGVLLVIAAGVITVNLEITGGLLLYSLIANPAVAALRAARRFRTALAMSAAFGAASALGGLAAAYVFNVPVGACIVLWSSVLTGIVHLAAGFHDRRVRDG